MNKIRWMPVIVFYLLALAISGPFFYWRTILHWEGFPGPDYLKTPSYMWGPGIAGIACYLLYRNRFKKEITIRGSSLAKSLIIWFVPLLLLAAMGIRTGGGKVDHMTPALLSLTAFFTIWGEEFGWRWFLQDYLKPISPMKKYILIGMLWELWHFRFLSKIGEAPLSIIFSTLITIGIVIGLSIIIGVVTDRTKSLFFASALHGWVDLCAEMPGVTTFIAAGVMLALCAWFYFTWKGPEGGPQVSP